MKKFLLLSILPLLMACNGDNKAKAEIQQPKVEGKPTTHIEHKVDTVAMIKKGDPIPIDKIYLNQPLGTILKPFHLTKDDNSNLEYNVKLDYEEFAFDKQQKFSYNSLNVGKIESLIIYYLKADKSAFSYELELKDNPNCQKIVTEIGKKFGKNIFYNKAENTKARPIFLDKDGEPETQHITQELYRWNDQQNHSVYYVIHTENLSAKTNKLTVIVISKTSKKFDEWVSYRSLNMVFN